MATPVDHGRTLPGGRDTARIDEAEFLPRDWTGTAAGSIHPDRPQPLPVGRPRAGATRHRLGQPGLHLHGGTRRGGHRLPRARRERVRRRVAPGLQLEPAPGAEHSPGAAADLPAGLRTDPARTSARTAAAPAEQARAQVMTRRHYTSCSDRLSSFHKSKIHQLT